MAACERITAARSANTAETRDEALTWLAYHQGELAAISEKRDRWLQQARDAGATLAEIANALGVSKQAVDQRLRRRNG